MTPYERVRRALARALEIEEARITPQTRLADLFHQELAVIDEGGDSLDLIEATMALEETLTPFPEIDLDEWKRLLRTGTVQDLADLLGRD